MPTALNSSVGTVQKMAFSDRCHALSAKMVRLFLATLMRVCLVSKPRQLAMLLRPPPFSRMTETKFSLSGDDGQFSSVSARSLSYGSTEPSGTSVHKDFLLGMKMAACHAGFLLLPISITRMISHLPEGFYNLSRHPYVSNLCHPPCLTFGSALRYCSNTVRK